MYRWLVGNRHCSFAKQRANRPTPSEYQTNVSSLALEMARTDTMNKELQTVRLQQNILI